MRSQYPLTRQFFNFRLVSVVYNSTPFGLWPTGPHTLLISIRQGGEARTLMTTTWVPIKGSAASAPS